MGQKYGNAEEILRNLESASDVRKAVKDSMDLPIQDQTQLFGRFATPDTFKSEAIEPVTRENATGNLSETDFKIVTTTGSIRSNFIHFKRAFMNVSDLEEKKKELKKSFDEETDIEKKSVIKNMLDDTTFELQDSRKAVRWIDMLVDMIGDDIVIRATTSKSRGGWLGNLIISTKKLAQVTTNSINEAKSFLGLRR